MVGQRIQVELNEGMPMPPKSTPFHLIIGIISDLDEQVIPLLQDVILLKEKDFLAKSDVLLLGNSPGIADTSKINRYLDQISNNSIIISRKQQILDSKNGLFGPSFICNESRLPICKARTILQKYLGLYAINNPESIVWILDDDMRLHDKVFSYLPWLPELKSKGIDILLGRFDGGSPNPPMNAVRVQTFDLLYNLDRLENHEDNEVLPDLEHENRKLRKKYPDYYYDLSRKHTGHLESPYWVNKIDNKETVGELRERILQNISKIVTGEPFFRPLIIELPKDPINEAVDSVNRGGNTFVFNYETLLNTPNPSIIISGNISRRSDMLWALINRYHYGCNIKILNFPVIHNRNINNRNGLNIDKTIQEIHGASLYAGLTEYFSHNPSKNFIFTDGQVDEICDLASAYLVKRISQYQHNFIRICDLSIGLKKYEKYGQVREYISMLDEAFSNDNLDRFIMETRKLDYSEVKNALKSISYQIKDYSNARLKIKLFELGDT